MLRAEISDKNWYGMGQLEIHFNLEIQDAAKILVWDCQIGGSFAVLEKGQWGGTYLQPRGCFFGVGGSTYLYLGL